MQEIKQDIKDLVKHFVRSKKIKNHWMNKFQDQYHESQEYNYGKKKQKYTVNPITLDAINVHSFTSAYKNSFHSHKHKSLNKLSKVPPRIKKSQQKLPLQAIIKTSSYKNHYSPQKEDFINKLKCIKNPNNLSTGGPFYNYTTYSSNYNPEKKSQSIQKIKARDNLMAIGDSFKLKTETSYNRNYQQARQYIKNKPQKRKETLKTQNLPFRNSSTYKNTFQKKNPFYQSESHDLISQKITLNYQNKNKQIPISGLKMKTSYQNEYDRKIIQKFPTHNR